MSSGISKDDIDFENFKVEEDRADGIRKNLEALKATNLITDLILVVNELGEEKIPSLSGFAPDTAARIWAGPETTPLAKLNLGLQGQELRGHWGDQLVFEVAFLPKGGDFALMFLDESLWAELNMNTEFQEALKDILRQAKSAKSSRAQAWKDRFQS